MWQTLIGLGIMFVGVPTVFFLAWCAFYYTDKFMDGKNRGLRDQWHADDFVDKVFGALGGLICSAFFGCAIWAILFVAHRIGSVIY